ncbi:hypothetical protein C2F68_RS23110 [Vibrio parahaemolyticus]|nr:hypothetical protein [Vibrio parahaemolyticus]
MKNQDCTTEEIAKTKEPNSVHEFALPAMLQPGLQQAKNSDDQRSKMLLNLGNRTKESSNKWGLSLALPFPHFEPTKLTTKQH